MVMADDMRVDDLLFTPRLRRLVARDGLTFENSFAPYPLCCPARASFLTGEYAHNHGVFWHEPPYGYGSFDDSRTLGTALKQAGYHTGFVGKYLNRYGVARSRVTGAASWHYVPAGWSDWIAAFENPHVRGIHGDTYDYFDTPYNVKPGRRGGRLRRRPHAEVRPLLPALLHVRQLPRAALRRPPRARRHPPGPRRRRHDERLQVAGSATSRTT
jgi:arylsulfatase A-like enzyme